VLSESEGLLAMSTFIDSDSDDGRRSGGSTWSSRRLPTPVMLGKWFSWFQDEDWGRAASSYDVSEEVSVLRLSKSGQSGTAGWPLSGSGSVGLDTLQAQRQFVHLQRVCLIGSMWMYSAEKSSLLFA